MYKTYYTYIMSNKNNTVLYIGVTNDIKRRVEEHKSGQIAGFTRKYNCHKLVHYEIFSDINQAIEREKMNSSIYTILNEKTCMTDSSLALRMTIQTLQITNKYE